MEVKFTETEIEGAILGNLESVRLIEVLTVLGIHNSTTILQSLQKVEH